MIHINKMLSVISDLQLDINKEIIDDNRALEVWKLMCSLEDELLDIKEQQEKKENK